MDSDDSHDHDYDPELEPDAEAWLELDEDERIALVERFHGRARVPLPNAKLHAVMHAVIETQLTSGDPPQAREAMARLRQAGMARHEALHALSAVLVRHLHAMFQGTAASGDPVAAYARDLDAMDASDPWRDPPGRS